MDHDLRAQLHAASDHWASSYADLSREHAAHGEEQRAIHAAWAADLQVLQTLLWESGLESAPDPHTQLGAVAEALDAVLAEHAAAIDEPMTARECIERARAALVSTFDESVHDLVARRFVALDHLDHLDAPDTTEFRLGRLVGEDVDRLVADLRATARDCTAVAAAMVAEGDPSGATHQMRQADLAAFEAYLVTAALRVGDTAGATVDLRWELARAATLADADLADADLRSCLVSAVGPVEEGALREFLEPGARCSA